MKANKLLFTLTLACGLTCTSAALAAQYTLKVGHSAQTSFHMHKAWEKFADEVKKGSNGEIDVQIFPADQMGNSLEQLEYVQTGTLDMTSQSMSLLANWDKAFGITEMPYVFTSREEALSVLNGDFGQYLFSKLEPLELKGLAVAENGFRQITNNRGPIYKPDDLKNLKIRTMQIDSHILAYRHMGANPTPMAFGELYSALQQGVVDGQDNPLSQIVTSRFYEVQKYVSLANIVYSTDVVLIGLNKYNSLPEKYQTLIKDAMKSAMAYQQELIKQEEDGYVAFLEKAGLKVNSLSPEQIAAFKEKVNEVRPQMIKSIGQENWDKLESSIKAYHANKQ
ncbi:ABC transporter substrate-binding protein [Leminorella grimontii]|uniref:ABC transporter substrate-binding protein n=1 Tax=Leminorella grimontii TaxID=82981 RepID=A0AAV5N273_9GAMM|nr:TRAP transporter substrate-binding protein [Leminorella grimontii]KFC96041.1 periplasmic component of a TRAP-type C4-dicarboxylate transporter [Leminorella grimontii ATCC 33999 = DSM 5078]GKX54777.1 ABC transporter substrate-binding protein [Leminorella grimontii]GKX58195.1 ABC transporter substrate-binding protein [Leminorella grimontii]VFS58456.1 Neu5Ac-binding protein [Leminorella grimontii]